ncbi:hypothetical protein AVEN_102437-1 [Araneus ventricosus]|uniref:CCHC-type domain-containing protein n=1 Tax=Araneus ventricosus TaxID=182803 RepID=A0A4Y2LNW6_ARAVE|nr:hypothetical protein AVEN_102437-1 [Araneus ventricosus]
MNDLTLRDKCQVYIPMSRVRHIIIFDIPPQYGYQAAHENNFILQLKESNELTDQEIKVVFKKKGRGSLQNWILAMQPKTYQEIKDKKRLSCGFNSHRFKEFLAPLRCFGCYRFGHLKRNCRETKPTLLSVLQTMIRKDVQNRILFAEIVFCTTKVLILKSELTICQIQTYAPSISVRYSSLRNIPFMGNVLPVVLSLCFLQANLGRSRMATQELTNLCFSNKIPDVFLLQEPYLKKGRS